MGFLNKGKNNTNLFQSHLNILKSCKTNIIKDFDNTLLIKNYIFPSDLLSSYLLKDNYFISNYEIEKIIKDTHRVGIYVVKQKKNKKKVICKVYPSNSNIKTELQIYEILKKNKSNYVCKYLDYYNKGKINFFILEYIDGNNLNYIILKEKEKINNKFIKTIFIQILKGLEFLHQNKIIHCDIKPENIMITKDYKVKLIDFNYSIINELESDIIFGTTNFISPESYNYGYYTFSSDIWSCGISLYYCLVNKSPYATNILINKSNPNLFRRNEFKHLDLNLINTQNFRNIIEEMTALNFLDRPQLKLLIKKFESIKIDK